MTDEITLTIPRERAFHRIAHLVTGGLALRLDLTYEDLDDVQVALEALLGLRDDENELFVSLLPHEDVLRTEVGPFDPAALREDAEEGATELDLRRVLDTVCDTHEIDRREDGAWVQLTKRIATPAGATG